jgi:hypothetical protein
VKHGNAKEDNMKKPKQLWRGHEIYKECSESKWYYSDTNRLVSEDVERVCGYCHLPNNLEGHDSCLGTLRGVMNACCGHGQASDGYIRLEGGAILSEDATKVVLMNVMDKPNRS